MENFLNFLADNYIWFAVASGFFLLSLIGLIYESKKKKREEANVASATVQPLSANTNILPRQEVKVEQKEEPAVTSSPGPAPSLAGLEAKNDNFEDQIESLEKPAEVQTLVIEDPDAMPTKADNMLVIDDNGSSGTAPKEEAPSEEKLPVEENISETKEEQILVLEESPAETTPALTPDASTDPNGVPPTTN